MESGHHCPFVGLKQNRSIRFASPTPEHRCYITGEPQDIPIKQDIYCLSSNHVSCPLYTGETLPSIDEVVPVAMPVPVTGIRGWFQGLSERDRRIYMGLVGLLGMIILAYIISGIFLFTGDNNTAGVGTATATRTSVAPTPEPTLESTAIPSDTPEPSNTATTAPSTTPAPSATASPRSTATTRPTQTRVIIVPPVPTDVPFVPTDVPVVPTDVPVVPSDTAVVPSDTAVVPTATPFIIPTFPTEEIPTPILQPSATPGEQGRGEPPVRSTNQVYLYFANSNGRVLVPTTHSIATTQYPRTAALKALLAGPSNGIGRLIPQGTELLDLYFENGTAYANFNQLPTTGSTSYSDQGLRSIILVLTEYSTINQVQLQVEGQNIGAARYRPTINPDNPQNLDGGWSTTSFLPLYFPLYDSGHMVRVMRLVPKTTSLAQQTIEGLIAGPGSYSDILEQAIPRQSRVQRLIINNGTAELDLSQAFLEAPDRKAAIQSLSLALTTFDSIERIELRVDGQPISNYWGEEYRGPFTRPQLHAN